jgi:hypothetical protein
MFQGHVQFDTAPARVQLRALAEDLSGTCGDNSPGS